MSEADTSLRPASRKPLVYERNTVADATESPTGVKSAKRAPPSAGSSPVSAYVVSPINGMLVDTPYARPPYAVLIVPTSEGEPPPPKAETPVATTTSAKSKANPAFAFPLTRRAPYANACMSRAQGTPTDKRQAVGFIGV